jgi:hypothetical protein
MTYLLNCLPTKTISASCPHYALFGTPPTYEHIRVIGCECYPNLSSTTPHKLAPHSTWCVFLGYSEHHKGYQCLDLSTNCLVISRYMVFDEAVFPFAASPHRTNYLNFLLSETTHVVPPIGTSLPKGSTAPCVATIMPEPSSLADEEAQADPWRTLHRQADTPLASRVPAIPNPMTPTPRAAPAPTPGVHTRSAWPH